VEAAWRELRPGPARRMLRGAAAPAAAAAAAACMNLAVGARYGCFGLCMLLLLLLLLLLLFQLLLLLLILLLLLPVSRCRAHGWQR
jgi:hypothetical protein